MSKKKVIKLVQKIFMSDVTLSDANKVLSDMGKISKISKRLRKDKFFRLSQSRKKPEFFSHRSSFLDKLNSRLFKQQKEVKQALGENTLSEILGGTRKSLSKRVSDSKKSGDIGKRIRNEIALDRFNDNRKKINKGFKKFGKMKNPNTNPALSVVNKSGLKKGQITEMAEDILADSGDRDFLEQRSKLLFERNDPSKVIKSLKKDRKKSVLAQTKPNRSKSQLNKDITMRGNTKVRFVRIRGRIVPIRVKNKK